MGLTKSQVRRFQSTIFRWWKINKRDLPWRHTQDPYKIAVSEIMLQQTQVSRVLTKYTEFLKAFPNVQTLAKASPAQVLRVWKGMGYNRRALYLHALAKEIVNRYNSKFPKDEKSLIKLPGLGIYTARAILVFAYRQEVATVDTNIRKIITHFFFDDAPQKPAVIQSVADELLPEDKSWEWHQALMDYGALRLTRVRSGQALRGIAVPFKESNRFYRGRIVDLLREKYYKENILIKKICEQYEKSEIYISSIINGLIDDGLIEKRGKTILLPE